MLTPVITYLVGATLTLALLSAMILKIGALMSGCPENGPAARTAAITVATGFAAIGAGGVLLVAGVLPLFEDASLVAALVGLGFAALCLGLGFTQAVATLRDVLSPSRPSTIDRNPWAAASEDTPPPAHETGQSPPAPLG